MIRKLGYRQDPPDARDLSAEPRLGAPVPPPSADLRNYVVEVLDQGNQNSCVANAGMQAVRMNQLQWSSDATQPVPPLGSRAFGYFLSRAFHHDTNRDEGTFIRCFFAALNKFGFPKEVEWPYSTPYEQMPSSATFRAAYDQKAPTEYRRITSTGAARLIDVKRAVASGHPVVFGTLVSVDFASDMIADGPLAPPLDIPIAGGHAMVVAGYDADGFNVVNSWGKDWGINGWCLLSPEYLAWPATTDLWIVETAPKFSE